MGLGDRRRLHLRQRQCRDRRRGRGRPARRSWPGWPRPIGASPATTLAMSTGIIGTRLPLDLVLPGIDRLVAGGLAATDAGARGGRGRPADDRLADQGRHDDGRAARPPRAVRSRSACRGMAKGVGMIHPRMATMLGVLLTDATIDPATLSGLLRPAAARTWNQLTVDGDTSTNDTVFLLACGAAGGRAGRRGIAGGARRSAPRSRRSPATWPASRRPTARAPRRSSPAR